jgi:hypothetical protein
MLLFTILFSAALVRPALAQSTPAQPDSSQVAPALAKPAPKPVTVAQVVDPNNPGGSHNGRTVKKTPPLPPPFGVNDVVKMLNAKVAEPIIIDIIRKQNIKLSLTSQDVVNLSIAGATPNIMYELDPSLPKPAESAPPPPPPPPVVHEEPVAKVVDLNDPESPHSPGVYIYTEDKNGKRQMIKLEKTVPQTSRSKMQGFLGEALYAYVPGPAASVYAPDRQPVFYMYAPPEEKVDMTVDNPGQLELIRMDAQSIYGVDGRRFLYAKQANLFSRPIIGTDPKAMRSFKSERKGPGYFRMLPYKPLEPGQYCFFYYLGGLGAGKGTEGSVMLLDFGVE